ncbi:MAG: hypothetical protein IPJ61_21160 [Tessaracoccus sp.]|uniref:phospholipase D-like domain-containing protein n=1 Tax=Tessaracoccus sp. TaxID=1971211 RepID=UPI001ED6D817|nr:phospholipase D-like domain-containing protein [Tessaracoccus sp.]MBK7823498.1 hypothetical protein [Tessaracoccus sp.]
MRIIGNALNGDYFENLVRLAAVKGSGLQQISLAVAWVKSMDPLFELAKAKNVPLTLYALAEDGFPATQVVQRFVDGPTTWQLLLTRRFYHPKIVWFRGVGVYIGSANLTTSGWWDNLECGVWFTQDEIERDNLDVQLTSMFAEVAKRSTGVNREHLAAFRRLDAQRAELTAAERAFQARVDKEFANLGGQDKPIRPTTKGGAARQQFIAEWQNGLGLLQKIVDGTKLRTWPSWVAKDAHPAIVQDQATEYWYHRNIRLSGDSVATIDALHRKNRGSPDAALDQAFAEWEAFEGDEKWTYYINEGPRRVGELLQRTALTQLDEDRLTEILHATHAAREHARQMRKKDLGDEGTTSTSEERSRLFARYLLGQESADGKTVQDVLRYVIWGDDQTPDVGERIWDAVHEEDWKLPHLGPSILGEMVGYARPDQYPPRNGRVSKTLAALGYEGVAY